MRVESLVLILLPSFASVIVRAQTMVGGYGLNPFDKRKTTALTKTHLSNGDKDLSYKDKDDNKPELATMRPDCVSAYIDHVTQMDKQTDGTTRVVMEALKSCLSRSRFSVGSRRGRKRPKTAVFAQA